MKRKFHINNTEVALSNISVSDGKLSFLMDGEPYECKIVPTEDGHKTIVEGKEHFRVFVGQEKAHGRRHVFVDGKESFVAPVPRGHKRQAEAQKNSFVAPMPGKVIEVHVKPGDTVKKGEAVITMEAMKLQHTLHAPQDGVVEEVHYAVGAQVHEGVLLVRFEEG